MEYKTTIRQVGKEEYQLKNYYECRMTIANDGYYVDCARQEARNDAEEVRNQLNEIINKKLKLLNEIKSL